MRLAKFKFREAASINVFLEKWVVYSTARSNQSPTFTAFWKAVFFTLSDRAHYLVRLEFSAT